MQLWKIIPTAAGSEPEPVLIEQSDELSALLRKGEEVAKAMGFKPPWWAQEADDLSVYRMELTDRTQFVIKGISETGRTVPLINGFHPLVDGPTLYPNLMAGFFAM